MIKRARSGLWGLVVAALAVSVAACDAPTAAESQRAPVLRGTLTESSSTPAQDVLPSVTTSDSVGVTLASDSQSVQYGTSGTPTFSSYTETINGVTYSHLKVYVNGQLIYHFIFDPSTGLMKVFHVIDGQTVWEYWGVPKRYPIVVPATSGNTGGTGGTGSPGTPGSSGGLSGSSPD